jgi:S1-C subfamily serine protease
MIDLASISNATADLVDRAATGVVAVRSHRALSSGFFWRPGLIVTADEALAEEGEIAVTLPGGERRAASLAGRDPTTDIALLRVEGGPAAAPSTPAGPARAGALAVAIGASGGAPLAALGAISQVGPAWRSMRGGEIDARIELDLRLRRQAEGALVLDAAGGALGMAVFGPRQRVLVIPAATIDRVAQRLASHGRIARGYLGLGLQPVHTDAAPGRGAMVMSVDAEGPGAAAGIRQGDIIVAWQGTPVESIGALLRALGPDSVGTSLQLGFCRSGALLQTSLTIGERPVA